MNILDKERISRVDTVNSLHDLQYVSFDVETTGLSPVVARLVEISGVKFYLDGTVVSTFSSLIDPEIRIPQEVSAIHGITDEMVAGAPKCDEVIPEFLSWMDDRNTVLVAHNAPFDVEFLQVTISRRKLKKPSKQVIDTLPLSRQLLPQAPNHQLKTLIEYLGLEAGAYHRALADSHHVKNVLCKIVTDNSLRSWADLCAHGCVFSFDADLFAMEPPAKILETIERIKSAMAAGASLTFVYNGFRSFRRIVDPVALIHSRGSYYLTAYCRKVAGERTFRLDKITQLQTGIPAPVMIGTKRRSV